MPNMCTWMQEMPVRHVLDVMHIEKNIAESTLKHLFGEKDTPESRRDMEAIGVRPELWLRPRPNGQAAFKPTAPYVLTDTERKMFIAECAAIRTPTGYGSTLGKHLSKARFVGLKSHDYHCLLQQIVPVVSRTLLHPFQRTTLIRLGKCMTRICAKVVVTSELPALRLYVIETLCFLEVCFPPGFFDIMEHLLVHLVDELAMCGPIGGRWMYPCERYLGKLKSFVRNKAHPEASMAKGYVAEEALGFCTEYLQLERHIGRHIWDAVGEESKVAAVVEGHGRAFSMSDAELQRVHTYVIGHHAHTKQMRG